MECVRRVAAEGRYSAKKAFAFAEKWGYMNYMKKVLAAIIALVMVFSVSVAGFAAEVNIEDSKVDPVNLKGAYCGDADGNKSVDITDAMLVFYHVAKKAELPGERLPYVEVTGDTSVDISDAMAIFYYVAKRSDTLVIENRDVSLEIFETINSERAANGLAPLSWDENLYAASMIRAHEYARYQADGDGAGPHKRPDGRDCFTAIFENSDYNAYSFQYWGENCAGASWKASGAYFVSEIWMNSPGHRANILTESYTAMAVAVCEHSNGWYYTSNCFVGDWQY